jgi:carbon monoxide dehydrogenase subunit G
MPGISVSRDVAAPPARVWDIVTDLDRSADVISGIDSVERLDGGGAFGVGTRWRETRTMFGRQATEGMSVTAMEPGRSYTVEADSRGAHYRSTVGVEPRGADASHLSMTFAGEPSGAVAKVLAATVGRVFDRATRKALARDLDDIAAAAERGLGNS